MSGVIRPRLTSKAGVTHPRATAKPPRDVGRVRPRCTAARRPERALRLAHRRGVAAPAARSMPEMPHPGEHHRPPRLIRRRDHLVVADRAAGLDHRSRACLGGG